MKVKCDHRSKFSNLSNWKEEAWKKSGLQRDSNPWPPRYRCDALPTELWSHTLGARSIYWVHFFPCSCSCLNWKIYCDDHTSLSSTTAVQIWIISYIFHMISLHGKKCIKPLLLSFFNRHDSLSSTGHYFDKLHRYNKLYSPEHPPWSAEFFISYESRIIIANYLVIKKPVRKDLASRSNKWFREFRKPPQRRQVQQRLKKWIIFYLRILRYSKVIYFVFYHCQNYHETISRTQR